MGPPYPWVACAHRQLDMPPTQKRDWTKSLGTRGKGIGGWRRQRRWTWHVYLSRMNKDDEKKLWQTTMKDYISVVRSHTRWPYLQQVVEQAWSLSHWHDRCEIWMQWWAESKGQHIYIYIWCIVAEGIHCFTVYIPIIGSFSSRPERRNWKLWRCEISTLIFQTRIMRRGGSTLGWISSWAKKNPPLH